jgi:Outer membrane protein beta-barrel domain
MRKVLFGLTMLIATTKTVTAQHAEFGVKGGFNAAKFSDNGTSHLFKPSVNVGILGHIHITKSFAIQPELVYSGQGTAYTSNSTDFRYNLGYINLPVLFQLMTASGFRFETGPQVGALINAKAKSGKISTDVKDNFNPTDFSWAFGVGYITPSKFGFDVRYNAGISDITKSNETNVKNNVIQAGVFYQFH